MGVLPQDIPTSDHQHSTTKHLGAGYTTSQKWTPFPMWRKEWCKSLGVFVAEGKFLCLAGPLHVIITPVSQMRTQLPETVPALYHTTSWEALHTFAVCSILQSQAFYVSKHKACLPYHNIQTLPLRSTGPWIIKRFYLSSCRKSRTQITSCQPHPTSHTVWHLAWWMNEHIHTYMWWVFMEFVCFNDLLISKMWRGNPC